MRVRASVVMGDACTAWMSWNLRRVWPQQATIVDGFFAIEVMKSCVGIGLQRILEFLQVPPGMFPFAIFGVSEPHGRARAREPGYRRRGYCLLRNHACAARRPRARAAHWRRRL